MGRRTTRTVLSGIVHCVEPVPFAKLNTLYKSSYARVRAKQELLAGFTQVVEAFFFLPHCKIKLVLVDHVHPLVSSESCNLKIWMLNPHSRGILDFSGEPLRLTQ